MIYISKKNIETEIISSARLIIFHCNIFFQKFDYRTYSIWKIFHKEGLLRELGITASAYLILYYIINLFLVQEVLKSPYCEKSIPIADQASFVGNIKASFKTFFLDGNSNLKTWIENWNNAEADIQFTFFLGAYVATLLARWWQQVSAIPKLDNLISALHSDTGISQAKRKDGVIAEKDKMFKSKVVRYCLLSITLRLADLSSKVRRNFSSKDDYIKKGLLTEDEYDEFAGKGMFSKTTVDGLSSKWFLPLSWAAFTVRDAGMDSEDKSLKEHKLCVKELGGIQKKLLNLTDFKKYHLPELMNQAVTLVIFVYFFCGLIASQGQQSCEILRATNKDAYGGRVGSTITALLMNFPFFQIMKYLLILTWFRVGKYLQRPFGHDR